MKWFKHYTNAHKGSVLQYLSNEFSIKESYFLYFRFVEYLADKWNGSDAPEFVVNENELRKFLIVTQPRFNRYLTVMQRRLQISFEKDGKLLHIKFPKLLEIRHKDALSSQNRAANGPPSGPPREEENRSSCTKEISPAKRQEARFRFAKEISEIEGLLATLFDGLAPKAILNLVPDMIIVCDGDPLFVRAILDDLYQSPKIRTGEGLEGSKSAYITAAIQKRFFDNGAA